jgi:hypothetical protein
MVEYEPYYERDAARRWEEHMRVHNTSVRAFARANNERAAEFEAMIAASLRSYKRLRPGSLDEGDAARVSFLVLAGVRAVVKTAILGEPVHVPLWSPAVYVVTRVHEHGSFATYDLRTEEDGETLSVGGI